jgi:starch synthase
VPVVAFIGRMATQKGLDIVVHNTALFHFAAQYVFLGSGDQRLEQAVHALHRALPNRVGVETTFSDPLEHVMIAGADLYLMPSQYEPCGLTQMRAQRYGTVPIARRVGGLADTIDDGVTGFLFDAFDERALVGGVWRAMTEHRSTKAWREMQREGMAREWGWDRAVERYVDIYARAIALAARRVA